MSTSTGAPGGQDGLTLDELAHAVAMTPRNVRAYQTRGLLHPPTLHGRVGRYDGTHLSRLMLIKELHGRGLNLAAIEALLHSREVVTWLFHDMRERLRAEGHASADMRLPSTSVARLRELDPSVPDELARRGLLRRDEEGEFVVDPVQFTAAATLIEQGLPVEDLVQVFREVSEASDRVATVLAEVLPHVSGGDEKLAAKVRSDVAPYALQLCATGFESLLSAHLSVAPTEAVDDQPPTS